MLQLWRRNWSLQCVISLNCLCWFPLLSTIHESLGRCHVRLTEASGEAIKTSSCLEGTVSGISGKNWTVSIQMLHRGVVDTYYRCNMNKLEWNEGTIKIWPYLMNSSIYIDIKNIKFRLVAFHFWQQTGKLWCHNKNIRLFSIIWLDCPSSTSSVAMATLNLAR